jgi:lysophospholipase L1-like esterase
LDFCLRQPVVKAPANGVILLKSKYRKFFTRHFPKTYVAKGDYEKNYRYILEQIEHVAASKHIYMINIADTNQTNKEKSFNYEKNISDYNGIINKLATENDKSRDIIDFYGVTRKDKGYILADGIHPSKSGHNYLARALFEKISRCDLSLIG